MSLFRRTTDSRRRSIIRFNHIPNRLSEEEVEMLKRLYEYYHMLSVCYQWQYLRLKKLNLIVNMSAIFFTIAGGAFVPLGGFATLSISAFGLLMHGFKEKYLLTEKVGQCEFAYKTYSKCLYTIKGYLRGIKFDRHTLFNDLSMSDNLINERCIPISKSIKTKYNRRYLRHLKKTTKFFIVNMFRLNYKPSSVRMK